MKRVVSIVLLIFLINGNVFANNKSDIYGKKKSKQVTHYNCEHHQSSSIYAAGFQFGIIFQMSNFRDGYHFAISYDKNEKIYKDPYSIVKYFTINNSSNDIVDINFFITLSSPDFRKDLGPSIGLNILGGSIEGYDQILTTYWFNARNHTTNDLHLIQQWEEIIRNKNDKLDETIIEFSEKIYEILLKKTNLESLIEIVSLEEMKPEYDVIDWSQHKCKVRYQIRE